MKRRRWLQWGCAHCAALGGLAAAQTAWEVPPRFARPDVASDEGGLWALMDREEARLRRSPFRMREEPLGRYLRDLACRLGASHCPDIHVYAVRTPFFNASMAPNGMMQVWSGLLLRMENEAQLAAILAHEISCSSLSREANAGTASGEPNTASFLQVIAFSAAGESADSSTAIN